ncbi:hypothetical protein ACFSGX_07900 [Sphingomonas arantia]|uniref:Uncharacterized protein n=1 Tax=Sphingomonas arantia TaxID=1460676 RepID=A0ABW4TX53_9SPHN
MRLELQPISGVKQLAAWHPLVELLALFNGSCALDDLEWDDGEMLASYVEDMDPHARADYEAEPAAGIREAKDLFITGMLELIRDRQAALGAASPFHLPNDGTTLLIRKPVEEVTEASIAYSWMVLFWAISSKTDYLIITKQDRTAFTTDFAKVFEWICCLIMVARSPASVWYFGDSRDVREFLRRLERMVLVAGTGRVKGFAQLQANQVGANDGGVDILAIQTRQGAVPRDATAYLVGATIQQSDRRAKIMGGGSIARFLEFFERGPNFAFHGVLAVPFEASDIDQLNCNLNNCIYLSKAELISILGQYPQDIRQRLNVGTARRKIRQRSREISNTTILVGKAGDLRLQWA